MTNEFFRKIKAILRKINNGIKAFDSNIKKAIAGQQVLSKPLAQQFLNPYPNCNPFEIKRYIQEIFLLLNIYLENDNFENDNIVVILRHLGFSSNEWTTTDGSVDKKIIEKIDLKKTMTCITEKLKLKQYITHTNWKNILWNIIYSKSKD